MSEDVMNVKWPADDERADSLHNAIVGCRQAHLASNRLKDHLLLQNDVDLTWTIVILERHAEICCRMEKILLNWDSHHLDYLGAAAEHAIDWGVFVCNDLQGYLPKLNPEAHHKGLSDPTEIMIRQRYSEIADGMCGCDEFGFKWFNITVW